MNITSYIGGLLRTICSVSSAKNLHCKTLMLKGYVTCYGSTAATTINGSSIEFSVVFNTSILLNIFVVSATKNKSCIGFLIWIGRCCTFGKYQLVAVGNNAKTSKIEYTT